MIKDLISYFYCNLIFFHRQYQSQDFLLIFEGLLFLPDLNQPKVHHLYLKANFINSDYPKNAEAILGRRDNRLAIVIFLSFLYLCY